MKIIGIALVAVSVSLLSFASPASAAYKLEFKDGAAPEVWDTLEKSNGQYCTEKEYLGRYCVAASDIKKVYTVADGTKATEYGINIGENKIDAEASAANQRAVDDMNSQARQRDAAIDQSARQHQKQIDRNRRDGKADWAR